jgi:hypothetical protein
VASRISCGTQRVNKLDDDFFPFFLFGRQVKLKENASDDEKLCHFE